MFQQPMPGKVFLCSSSLAVSIWMPVTSWCRWSYIQLLCCSGGTTVQLAVSMLRPYFAYIERAAI